MIDKEKVRELVKKVIYANDFNFNAIEVATEWFEQNQPEPIIVGLSDEQIDDLANKLTYDSILCGSFRIKNLIADWQKTQTFAQPNESLIADNLKLANELEQLKSQLQPNWDDAPVGAVKGINSTRWWNEKGEYIETTNSISFERPKPTPKVEVAQIWKLIGTSLKFEVRGDNKSEVYAVNGSGFIYSASISDFLANFERVS